MKNILFLVQGRSMGSSSRGPQAGGRILTMEDIKDAKYYNMVIGFNKVLYYQVGRSEAVSIKSMSLLEFEEYFDLSEVKGGKFNHLLGLDGGECVFRKEIKDKYGKTKEELEKPKPKMTTVYPDGSIVEAENGKKYLYLGYMSKFILTVNNNNISVDGGNFYIPVTEGDIRKGLTENFFKDFFKRKTAYFGLEGFKKRHFLKGRKRVKVGSISKGIEVPENGSWGYVWKSCSRYARTKISMEWEREVFSKNL